jgi:transposase InsO family protein
LQIFSSDTTCMKTIGAPKEWSWACATIDLCSKFVFGANVSYFNDEKLVNKTYIETQFHSGSIINTDHGRNHLSYLNRELLKKLKVFISAGRVGKLNIFEIAERQNVFIKLKQN